MKLTKNVTIPQVLSCIFATAIYLPSFSISAVETLPKLSLDTKHQNNKQQPSRQLTDQNQQ